MYCKKCGTKLVDGQCPNCHSGDGEHIEELGDKKYDKLLIEPDEEVIAAISRGYLSNVLLDSNISSDSVVLSNKRVYYSGRSISFNENKLLKAKGKLIIPNGKVDSFGVYKVSNPTLLFIAGILFIIGVIVGATGTDETGPLSLIFFVPAIILFIVYQFSVRNMFFIASTSSRIEADSKLYGEKEFLNFMNKLAITVHIVK